MYKDHKVLFTYIFLYKIRTCTRILEVSYSTLELIREKHTEENFMKKNEEKFMKIYKKTFYNKKVKINYLKASRMNRTFNLNINSIPLYH